MFDLATYFDRRHPDLGPDWVSDFFAAHPFFNREATTESWNRFEASRQSVSEDGTYTIEYTIPGYKKTELTIDVHDGSQLVVSYHKNNQEGGNVKWSLHPEFDINSIKASLEDGILTITYKLLEPKPKSTFRVAIT